MIVLRSPKGWTGPREVDGHKVEGSWRSHQVPLGGVRDNPTHLAQLEAWLRSYRPEELFDDAGRLRPRRTSSLGLPHCSLAKAQGPSPRGQPSPSGGSEANPTGVDVNLASSLAAPRGLNRGPPKHPLVESRHVAAPKGGGKL
jgi:hypothetical protein